MSAGRKVNEPPCFYVVSSDILPNSSWTTISGNGTCVANGTEETCNADTNCAGMLDIFLLQTFSLFQNTQSTFLTSSHDIKIKWFPQKVVNLVPPRMICMRVRRWLKHADWCYSV